MMARILRLALMVLMAVASAVFIYGIIQQFNRLPPQSATTNQATHNRVRPPVNMAKLLTKDEARRIAANVAKPAE
jgi:hypothetical protein